MKLFLPSKNTWILALILFSSLANAQNRNYVVTMQGDTLPCVMTLPAFANISKYKTANMPKAKKLNPDEIRRYYSSEEGRTMASVYTFGSYDREFMEVLELGKISLYKSTVKSQSGGFGFGAATIAVQTDLWYIGKGSDTVKNIKNGSWILSGRQKHKDDFGNLVKDNKVVYDLYIQEEKFSFKQLRRLVHFYNTGIDLDKG